MKKILIVMMVLVLSGCELGKTTPSDRLLLHEIDLEYENCTGEDCYYDTFENISEYLVKHTDIFFDISNSIAYDDPNDFNRVNWSELTDRNELRYGNFLLDNPWITTRSNYTRPVFFIYEPLRTITTQCKLKDVCNVDTEFDIYNPSYVQFSNDTFQIDMEYQLTENDVTYIKGYYDLSDDDYRLDISLYTPVNEQIEYYHVSDGNYYYYRYVGAMEQYDFQFIDSETHERFYYSHRENSRYVQHYDPETGFYYEKSTNASIVTFFNEYEFVAKLKLERDVYSLEFNLNYVEDWDSAIEVQEEGTPYSEMNVFNNDQRVMEDYLIVPVGHGTHYQMLFGFVNEVTEEELILPDSFDSIVTINDLLKEIERIDRYGNPLTVVGLSEEDFMSNIHYVYDYFFNLYNE